MSATLTDLLRVETRSPTLLDAAVLLLLLLLVTATSLELLLREYRRALVLMVA